MVVTFHVYLGRISARFDQRKAVMCVRAPFRVDKWQSPAQPSRADFARNPLQLNSWKSRAASRAMIPLNDTAVSTTETYLLCVPLSLLFEPFTIELKLKARLSFNCF